MNTYSLTAVVEGFDLDSEEQNATLENLGYPAVVGRSGGITTVDADITAPSAVDAFQQLASDLRGLGSDLVRVELPLVNISDIAERLDVSRETARLWSSGERRSDFPSHYQNIGNSRVWSWAEVIAWAGGQGIPVEEYPPLSVEETLAINGALAHTRNARHDGWLRATMTPRIQINSARRSRRGGWSAPVSANAA